MKLLTRLALCFLAAGPAMGFAQGRPASADTTTTICEAPANFSVQVVASDVRVPWAMTFAPDGRLFFTERPGRVRVLQDGKLKETPLFTVPDVLVNVKLGLMGMVLHPRFPDNHLLYLSYAYRSSEGERVRVARYHETGTALDQGTTIIENIPAYTNHAGCRIRFGPDAKLYVTTGDANKPELAQQLDSLAGKILRLNEDGTIPSDNPFAGQEGKRPEIWSYGHRNPQGLDWQPGTNTLFESEHGPDGGDEINVIEPGKNYGWPILHHRMPTREGMQSPLLEYTPSIAPASGMFYRGTAFPDLRGHFLVGCLRGEGILDLTMDGSKVVAQQWLLHKKHGRMREVVEAPDGSIYVSTSMYDPPESARGGPGYDQILRLVPASTNASTEATKSAPHYAK
ncbi:MAG: PQQ-dependent sugar dehydrogenase [Candidatus Sumerlaeaceae bacterium]